MKDAKKVTKSEKLLWLLTQPKYYSYLRNKIMLAIRSLSYSPESLKPASKAWFRETAIDLDSVFSLHFHIDRHPPFDTVYPLEFSRAEQAISSCPVKLPAPEPDPESMDLLYRLAEYLNAEHVVETGVAYGWSTLALLLSLQHRPDARLVSVDMPYLGIKDPSYVGMAVPSELRKQWKLIPQPDSTGLPSALKELPKVDLAYYDSDKTYEGRLKSYKLIWESLRTGGVFISDDIADNFGFRDFCQQIGQTPIVVKTLRRRMGLLIKP